MRSKIVLTLVVAALTALTASSQSAVGSGSTTLSWIPAVVYTNGAPMQLGSQRLFVARTDDTACNLNAAPTVFNQFASVSAGVATARHDNLWNGTYYYTAVSVDIFGNTSVNSNVACKRINIAGNWEAPPEGVRPQPPQNLQVQ